MDQQSSTAPVLIFTYGNPSRGDDALGPAMFEMLEAYKRDTGAMDAVDLLTDFQLQIEHAVDLENRRCVLFIDAGVACREPYELKRLQPARDDSFTTHAMSPAAVLAVYQQINHSEPPAAFLLTIRAYEFGLGLAISDAARENLQMAYEYVIGGPWPV
jgi:hydrogenase maturation protease